MLQTCRALTFYIALQFYWFYLVTLRLLNTTYLHCLKTHWQDGIFESFRSKRFDLNTFLFANRVSLFLAGRICSKRICTYLRSLMKTWQTNWNFWIFSSAVLWRANTRVETKPNIKYYLLSLFWFLLNTETKPTLRLWGFTLWILKSFNFYRIAD